MRAQKKESLERRKLITKYQIAFTKSTEKSSKKKYNSGFGKTFPTTRNLLPVRVIRICLQFKCKESMARG